MNEKFYVPFNTAQRLKANGYNEECERFYDHSGMLTPKPIVNNNKHLDHIYHDIMKFTEDYEYHIVVHRTFLGRWQAWRKGCLPQEKGKYYWSRKEAIAALFARILD